MRCLYCGKRLSLLHKLSGREFCNEEHRVQYMQDQESLGLARLIEAKQSSKKNTQRKKKKVRTSGPGGAPAVAECFFPEDPNPVSYMVPSFPAGEPAQLFSAAVLPQVEMKVSGCGILECSPRVPVASLEMVPEPAIPSSHEVAPFPLAVELPDAPAPVPDESLSIPPTAGAVDLWMLSAGVAVSGEVVVPSALKTDWLSPAPALPEPPAAPEAEIPVSAAATIAELAVRGPAPATFSVEPLHFRVTETLPSENERVLFGGPLFAEQLAGVDGGKISAGFVFRCDGVLPARGEQQRVDSSPVPVVAVPCIPDPDGVGPVNVQRASLRRLEPSSVVKGKHVSAEAMHLEETPSTPVWPSLAVRMGVPALGREKTVTLPDIASAEGPGPAASEPRPVRPGAFLVPPSDVGLSLPPGLSADRRPVPLPAGAGVSAKESFKPAAELRPVAFSASVEPRMPPAMIASPAAGLGTAGQHVVVSVPDRKATEWGRLAPRVELLQAAGENLAGAHDLTAGIAPPRGPVDEFGPGEGETAPRAGLILFGIDRILPVDDLNLYPGETALLVSPMKPLVRPSGLETVPETTASLPEKPPGPPVWERVWNPVVEHWTTIPKSVKWAALAAPLVIALLLQLPSREEVVSADTSPETGVSTVLANRWETFQENIGNRAAISLSDDFRSGLGNWMGKGDWAGNWSYDKAGFVRPGNLALYQPSLGLTDYEMAFAGQVRKRSMSWVFRASDTDNYYAEKLVITEPGPLPKAALIRYAVVNGKRDRPVRTEIPYRLRNQKLYQVRVVVRGNTFTTYLDGQLVNFFRDDRLKQGGVGFFSGRGDHARLRWVTVTHQYDFLGRICALVSPYKIENP